MSSLCPLGASQARGLPGGFLKEVSSKLQLPESHENMHLSPGCLHGASWPIFLQERSVGEDLQSPIRMSRGWEKVSPSRTLRTKRHGKNTDLPVSGKRYSTYQSFLYPLNKT